MHQSHQITSSRSHVVETLGDFGKTSTWLIALHGYGQLAAFFIRKFKDLVDDNTAVIVPEGPHRFYKEGLSGRVGASWMTKHNRELDISDNHLYLNEVYRSFHQKGSPERIIVLGFSQGAATACRWVATTEHPVHELILWSSMFPPDLAYNNLPSSLDIHLAYGQADPFLNDSWKDQYTQWKNRLPSFTTWEFEGGHDIYGEKLREILNR